MNTFQINQLLKKDPYAKQIFKGALARDQLPKTLPPTPVAYVVNTQASNHPGEHWVAIYFDRYGNGEFFDSYAFPAELYGFDTFMNQHSKQWIANDKPLQSLFGVTCAYFCVCYIILRCREIPMRSIISRFSSSNLTENDRKVTRFIDNYFRS